MMTLITQMINTLALFMSIKERKVSRYFSGGKRYIADLYLQGYIKKVYIDTVIHTLCITVKHGYPCVQIREVSRYM